ncbi:MAG: hypothetical protein ACC628_09805 [Pirellulaceae bacterium]
MKYLLPCDCGKSVRIEVSQAGQTVACACGKSLDIPAMRAIRELVPDEPIEVPSAGRRWSAAHGAGFAIGSLLLVSGLGIGIVSHLQYAYMKTQIPPLPSAEATAAWVAEIDDWSAMQAWEFWQTTRVEEVPKVSMHALITRRVDGVHQRALLAYGIAGGGLLLAIGTMWIGAGRKK